MLGIVLKIIWRHNHSWWIDCWILRLQIAWKILLVLLLHHHHTRLMWTRIFWGSLLRSCHILTVWRYSRIHSGINSLICIFQILHFRSKLFLWKIFISICRHLTHPISKRNPLNWLAIQKCIKIRNLYSYFRGQSLCHVTAIMSLKVYNVYVYIRLTEHIVDSLRYFQHYCPM
jgi:hypothetical protein